MRPFPSASLAFVAALQLGAQESRPRALSLPEPDAVLDYEFTRIVSVRELRDGRVLVVDGGDKKLSVADWVRRTVTQIGRQGKGPGEYTDPSRLLALAADSTLLVDAPNGRWLLLHGTAVVETVAADAPAIRSGARVPTGADIRGNVLSTGSIGAPPGGRGVLVPSSVDSLRLIRVARVSGKVDTLGMLRARASRVRVEGPSDRPTSIEITFNPLAAGEQALLFADGGVGIARVDPYRVDWIDAGGRRAAGAPLPFSRVRVDEREKRALLEREALQRGRSPRDPEAVAGWPETLPPFLLGALLAAPDGRLWIRRTPSATAPTLRFDIVSRRGLLEAYLTLNAQTDIVGLGRSSVFTIVTDADGVQRLQRHALPRF